MGIVENWKIREKADSFFRSDKKVRLIFLIGMVGIALIFLSGLLGERKDNAEKSTEVFDSKAYVAELEKRIHTMVTGMEGVGNAKVMITLENTTEYVYQSEKKENNDTTRDYASGETQKEQERNNYEQNVILVNGANGKREALLKTTIEPKVKGVVVVCQGGENIEVEKNVINAVTTALDISSSKVCVVKLSGK